MEFLGGTEEYKLQFADHFEPLYTLVGLADTPRGKVLLSTRIAGTRHANGLSARRGYAAVYYDGLGPLRRAISSNPTHRTRGKTR